MMPDRCEELFQALTRKGFAPEFCDLIARQLNTPWTSRRMLGYLREIPRLREEEVVDEMLCILEDRDRIIKKKEAEFYQGKVNEIYNYGLDVDEEDE